MTPNPDQNAAQNTVQDSAAQQGGTQRSARFLMNSLYRSPRARMNGAPDAEDTVPLAIAAEVTPAEVPAEETPAEPAASGPESNGWADWNQQPDWNEVDDWAEWEQADQPGTTRSTRWGLSPRVLLLVAVLAWLPWCGL